MQGTCRQLGGDLRQRGGGEAWDSRRRLDSGASIAAVANTVGVDGWTDSPKKSEQSGSAYTLPSCPEARQAETMEVKVLVQARGSEWPLIKL